MIATAVFSRPLDPFGCNIVDLAEVQQAVRLTIMVLSRNTATIAPSAPELKRCV
jgi:hypothetical protein